MPIRKKTTETQEMNIMQIRESHLILHIRGRRPFICEAMSEKARRELLFPPDKRGRRDRESLKHDPILEYRNSCYTFGENTQPTRLNFPGVSFKKAAGIAALRMGGATKTEIGQLVWIDPEKVPIYGVPQMIMNIVRSSDISRTPDVRTRAIVPEWACIIEVHYVGNVIKPQQITNLLGGAGIICGVGGWRQEKGSSNFGQFEIVEEDDPQFLSIVKHGGRAEQDAALKNPRCYDEETEKTWHWFMRESEVRERPITMPGEPVTAKR